MAEWVLLRHELPDGSWHHDWMLSRDDGSSAGLLTFRLSAEIGWPPGDEFRGVRLGDHRRAYLAYEGEVSGGRGRVRRVDSGTGSVSADGDDLVIRIERGCFRVTRLSRSAAGPEEAWLFRAMPPD